MKKSTKDTSFIIPPTRAVDALALDLNESYWYWTTDQRRELGRCVSRPDVIGRYPAYESLYRALARYTHVPKENLCITNGSDQAISFLITHHSKKRVAILPSPTFGIYPQLLKQHSIKTYTPVYTNGGGAPEFPLEETLALLGKYKGSVLFLCQPNNPLGVGIPKRAMDTMLKKARATGALVIIDEAYYEYHGDTYAPQAKKRGSNIIVVRSFSKGFGMPGLRLGYTIASPEHTQKLHIAKLPWNVNHPAVEAGIIALRDRKHFANCIKETHSLRKELVVEMRRLGLDALPATANFVTVCTQHAGRLKEYLEREHGILIKNVSGYPGGGTILRKAVRIAIPARRDIKKLIRALTLYAEEYMV